MLLASVPVGMQIIRASRAVAVGGAWVDCLCARVGGFGLHAACAGAQEMGEAAVAVAGRLFAEQQDMHAARSSSSRDAGSACFAASRLLCCWCGMRGFCVPGQR